MRLSSLSALALLLLAWPAPGRAQSGSPPEPIRAIEQGLLPANVPRGADLPRWSLAERMLAYNVPGVSVAVIDGGRIAWAHAWGVRRAGAAEPVDTATLFQAASISKPVAALAALTLVQQGRVGLDDDVNRHLRTWTLPAADVTRTEKVTLRRLLSHTAGLTVHGFRGYARGEAVPALTEVLDGAGPANSAPVRPDLVPGTEWRYSGGGTTVAQLLMMDVTGLPFDELMRATVLEPAGMVHSTYAQPLPAARAANAASGHRADGSIVEGDWHTYPEQAAAGLWTTPSDLARVALEVQRAWHGESDRIISQSTARTMLTEVDGDYGIGFGLGAQQDQPTFAHGGANEGFRAQFYAFRDGGRGAFIMTNGDAGSALAAEILRGIAHIQGWPGPAPRLREIRTVPAAELAALPGTYLARGDSMRVEVRGEEVHITMPGAGPRPYLAGADDRWFALGGGPELQFMLEDGRVDAVTIHGAAPQPIVARRREP